MQTKPHTTNNKQDVIHKNNTKQTSATHGKHDHKHATQQKQHIPHKTITNNHLVNIHKIKHPSRPPPKKKQQTANIEIQNK